MMLLIEVDVADAISWIWHDAGSAFSSVGAEALMRECPQNKASINSYIRALKILS